MSDRASTYWRSGLATTGTLYRIIDIESDGVRTTIKMSSYEVQVGDILWLPRKDQLPPDSLGLKPSNAARLQGGVFDHPVVVVDRRDHVVVIHIVRDLSSLDEVHSTTSLMAPQVTSFRGRSPSRLDLRRCLPIFPSPAHPPSDVQLKLENDAELNRSSYVRIDTQYVVDLASLRRYRRSGGPTHHGKYGTRNRWRLSKSSRMILRTYSVYTSSTLASYFPRREDLSRPSPRPSAAPIWSSIREGPTPVTPWPRPKPAIAFGTFPDAPPLSPAVGVMDVTRTSVDRGQPTAQRPACSTTATDCPSPKPSWMEMIKNQLWVFCLRAFRALFAIRHGQAEQTESGSGVV